MINNIAILIPPLKSISNDIKQWHEHELTTIFWSSSVEFFNMIQPPNFENRLTSSMAAISAFQVRLIHLGPGVAEPLHHLQVPPCCCDAQRGDAEAILIGDR